MRNTFAARLFLLLALAGGLDVSASGAAEPPVAVVNTDGGFLEWTPTVESEGIVLALADPQGLVRTLHFVPGETPILWFLDAKGMPLPDGIYTWEFRVMPRLGVDFKRDMEEARRRGDEGELARLSRLTAPLVQSGHFTLANGSLVSPNLVERPERRQRQGSSATPGVVTAPDQVVPDDLIVDGKGCIGLGCSNNEAFFAEALRLKQSVIRLRFEDTSAQAGFPARDWQLTVNDPGSGGADRFSIEDLTAGTAPLTVRGGAPSHSLYVDGLGNVGVGTSIPAQDIHVASGSTPTLRLEQTSGTVRAWDVGASNASFFVKDVTNASVIPFHIQAGALANSLVVGGAGPIVEVGIGTANPMGQLHIFGDAGGDVFAGMGTDLSAGPAFNYGYSGGSFGRSSGFFNIRPDASAIAPNPSLRFMTSNVQRMIIDNEGFIGLGVANPTSPIHHLSGAMLTSGGTWTNASSRDLKQDIRELSAAEAQSAFAGLVPVAYRYKAEPGDESVGFIAEDVPDLVSTPYRKTLSPMDIVAVLTKVLKEQQIEIEELRRQIEELAAQQR